MWLNQASKAPIVITVAGDVIAVPPFTLRDWILWGEEADARRLEQLTAGMGEEKRREFVGFYVVPPTQLHDLAQLAPSPAGVDRICRACLGRAVVTARAPQGGGPAVTLAAPEPVPAERVEAIIEANDPRVLSDLAARLARMSNAAEPSAAAAPDAVKGGPGPLAGSGPSGSTPSPGTGSPTSPSTPPPTPAATPSTTPSPCSSGS